MKLTEVGARRLVEHLQAYLKLDCPLCRGCAWNAADEIMQLTPFNGKSMIHSADVIPLVTIGCRGCGYTFLFNAISAGVIEVTPGLTSFVSVS